MGWDDQVQGELGKLPGRGVGVTAPYEEDEEVWFKIYQQGGGVTYWPMRNKSRARLIFQG